MDAAGSAVKRALEVLVAVTAMSAVRAAQADPPAAGSTTRGLAACASDPESGVPVRVPITGPADFGVLPEACPATSVAARGRAAILVAERDYYGSLFAGAALAGRVAVGNGVWLSLWAPGPEYRFVANATVEQDSADLSAGTLGVHVPLEVDRRLVVAPYGRVLIPTETVLSRGTRTGIEQGLSAVVRLGDRVELVGGWAFPLLFTDGGASVRTLFAPAVSTDIVLRPFRALAIAAGAAVRVVPSDPDPLESVDPRASLRLYPWRGTFVDVSGALPLGGRDRSDVAAAIALGWIWSR